jgi:hypothetical protein
MAGHLHCHSLRHSGADQVSDRCASEIEERSRMKTRGGQVFEALNGPHDLLWPSEEAGR